MSNLNKWGLHPDYKPQPYAWEEKEEDHVAEQFGEIWDGALKIFVSIIACIGLFVVLCAIAVDVLNNL